MAELIAGAFLSSFFQFTFARLASKDFKDLFHKGLLKKLEITLNSINQLLEDAETKQYQNQNVKNWLDELKHEVYEVDQLLDEIALEQQKSKAKRFFSTLTNPFESRIKDLLGKLNFLAEQKDVLGLKEGRFARNELEVGPKSSIRIPMTSLVDESNICGRKGDKEKIINFLLLDNGSSNHAPIISIVGLGGMGKTTLAQLVYNDHMIQESFDLKAWVYVSESFDVVGLTKAILESIGCSPTSENLEPLQRQLQERLTGKKYLLVLDDVWNGNVEIWDHLLLPFNKGSSGSKIIVTTRDREIAKSLKSSMLLDLERLEESDSWSLFVKLAFHNRNVNEYPILESIGKDIVDKCGGLPLAVKTLGNLLQKQFSKGQWEKILETDLWCLSERDSNINPVLRLSYHNLPSNMKRCFAYCSIFPKGYEFEKNTLINLWKAEGLLNCCRGDKSEEELGNELFNDLESISFFQQSPYFEHSFVMHDLVNDLTKSESLKFCLQIEGDKVQDICERTRHIWCSVDLKDDASISKQICKIKGLRGMLVEKRSIYSKDIMVSNKLQRDIFSKLKYLRMLSFRGCELIELSDKIDNLKLLRYLDVTRTNIKSLPDSMCELHNLDTLILEECSKLTELPIDFHKLVCLRNLYLEGTDIKKMPKKIGRLNHLQTLSHFVVAEKRECDIKELDNLNLLQGKLCISGLEHVINPADAAKANMKDKKHLEELIMQYSDSFEVNNNGRELDVLEALHPNSNLKKLTIENYSGDRFPNWLRDCHLPNLVFLKLKNCGLCSHMPPLGQLPHLKYLSISQCNGIKIIDKEFYGNNSTILPFRSLEVLEFRYMGNWEEWLCLEGFPLLEELFIEECPELKRVPPQHLPSLQKLMITGCDKLEECLCLEGSPILRELYIVRSSKLKRAPLPQHLPSLKKMRISSCMEEWLCLEEFPLLKELYIINCPELKRIPPQHLPSLQKLMISGCDKLEECLCLEESHLLEEVSIKNCSKLKMAPLPQHLPSLQRLRMDNCEMLEVSIPKGDSIIELDLRECDRILVNGLPTGLEIFVLEENRYTEFSVEDFCTSLDFSISLNLGFNNLSVRGWDSSSSLPFSLHLFTNLQSLCLYDCPQLESFPRGGLPSNLRSLEIQNCPKLNGSREEWGLFQLNSLKELRVSNDEFENVESFPEENLLPPTLSFLKLKNCSKLRIMNYKGFLHLNSLTNLIIINCPSLESLPEEGLPTSLSWLSISECPLIREKYKKEGGERWHTISHIPNVFIDE